MTERSFFVINADMLSAAPSSELHLIAHDIRSRENVGSLFRTCDSLGVAKLWLTGYTIAPPDPKLAKVALGAENVVTWEQRLDVLGLFEELRVSRIPLYGLELTPDAIDVADFSPPSRLALLLGSERTGIAPSLMTHCGGMIKIAQHGMKESLNVTIAAAISAWAILNAQSHSS